MSTKFQAGKINGEKYQREYGLQVSLVFPGPCATQRINRASVLQPHTVCSPPCTLQTEGDPSELGTQSGVAGGQSALAWLSMNIQDRESQLCESGGLLYLYLALWSRETTCHD